MLSISTLGEYLEKNPGIMENRTLLQGVLRDIFPQDKLAVNLLLMGFDEDIFSMVGTNPSESELMKLANSIINDFGITRENASYIIQTWLGTAFQEKLPSGFFVNHSPQVAHISRQSQSGARNSSAPPSVSSPPYNHNNGGLSIDDIREIFFRTKRKLMKECKFRRSQDLGTWDVVDFHRNEHYCRSLNQRERNLIIKKICKGLYRESDFAYIRTSTDMTLSWAVTYESIVISAKTDLMIYFADIDYVDSEVGLFTDTMTIFLKNGRSYELDEHQMMSTPLHDNISDLANFLNVIKDM